MANTTRQDGDSDIEILNDITQSVISDEDELEIVPNPPPPPIVDLSSDQNDISIHIDYPCPDQSDHNHNQNDKKRKIKFEPMESTEPPRKRQKQCHDEHIKQESKIKIQNPKGLSSEQEPKADIDDATESDQNCDIESVQNQHEMNVNFNHKEEHKTSASISNRKWKLKTINMEQRRSGRTKKSKKTKIDFFRIWPGLNYDGKCLNKDCVAYTEPISISRGFGLIEPNKDFENEFMKCPECQTLFDLRAISLCKCISNVEYQKMTNMKIMRKEISVLGDDYFKFGEKIKKGLDQSNQVRAIASRIVVNSSNNDEQRTQIENQHQYPILKFDVKKT